MKPYRVTTERKSTEPHNPSNETSSPLRSGCRGLASRKSVFLLLLFVAAAVAGAKAATPNILLWDTHTGTPNIDSRTDWKAVPSDLLSLEADPPKASSDPGYYGRDYSFKGDAIVQNRTLTALFSSSRGAVILYSKNALSTEHENLGDGSSVGTQIAELLPLLNSDQNTKISHVQIVRNAADRVILQVFFLTEGQPKSSCVFAFGKNEIIEIKPSDTMQGVRLRTALRFVVAPSFIGDDLVFDPHAYSSDTNLCIPAENMVLGLGEGEQTEVVITWNQPKASVDVAVAKEAQSTETFQAIDFQTHGQSLYLAPLSVPGLWHREVLNASFLEKDVPLNWSRPFPAKWKTQLYEEGVRTTFSFRNSKGQIWRGVPGSYNYPAWFEGDKALLHMSKKVAPKGESLIYFLESEDTPMTFSAPAEILRETLGEAAAEPILDEAGRKLRTHHRRGGDGVRRACTCGCTEAIQAVFQAGEETTQKEYIEAALGDMIYFVHRHVERINEYRAFAADLNEFLKEQNKSTPELGPFIESLEQVVSQIPQEYEVQKENMKSFDYADDLARRTLALTGQKDTNNFKAYMDLLKSWRDMGGAQDYVLAQCHMITRKLCQEAGYGCVRQAKAVALAIEVRKRCKQCLRNPDGYEIWADY